MKRNYSADFNILIFPAPYTIWQKFDNHTVILNFITGNYCSLNNETYKLIELLKNNIIPQNLPQIITKKYPVENSSFNKTIRKLIDQKIIAIQKTNLNNSVDIDFLNNFFKFFNFDNIDLHIYTNMQHVLKLDDIYNVDKKGWPVQNG